MICMSIDKPTEVPPPPEPPRHHDPVNDPIGEQAMQNPATTRRTAGNMSHL
jgi:hypothetical protein